METHLQFLLLLFSLFLLHLNACMSQMIMDSTTDKQALLSFKHQLNDPTNALSGWTQNSTRSDHCNWFGVSCSTNGSRVVSLQLIRLGLAGTLSPSLSNLTSLRTLNLSHNSFHGEFQLEFTRLSLLQDIDLRNNSISGTVPASLSRCLNLQTLSLQGNKFSGNLPPQLGNLKRLEILSIAINNLTGSIPSTFGNLSSLISLSLARNMLTGQIPSELGQLSNLQQIQLSENNLTGQIPPSFFNLSSLVFLSVTQNNLSGILPVPPNDHGFQIFPNLRELYLALNSFQGIIPGYISNASNIEFLDLSRNRFSGPIPLFGNMRNLTRLDLGQNLFTSNTARNFQFIDALTNCTQLEYLMINSNFLSGEFPSVANLSSNMQHFCISENSLTGGFPQGIDMLQNLISLSIEMNSFTGEIPRSIASLQNLQSFLVYQNMFSGEIPEIFSNYTRVSEIVMGNNQFSGKIPTSLGDCQQLEILDLSWNSLNGSIPEEIVRLSNLQYLVLVHNKISGPFLSDEVGNLKQLQVIDVSVNNLFGKLTSSISGCSSLLYLNISSNNISGEIPSSLGDLLPLEVLDFSSNNLSGPIPQDLRNLMSLQMLNLSFNHLEGEVPTGNIFSNLSSFFVHGNDDLCSSDQDIARNLEVPQCRTEERKTNHLIKILVPIAGAICLILCSVLAVLICIRKKIRVKCHKSSLLVKGLPPLISYSDIQLATNNFAAENLIGKGGFGSVYKGRFDTGDHNGASFNNCTVAVKVLDLQQTKAVQCFLAECETLRNVRHRNLVKLITSCSSIDHKGGEFKALVFELMPNGNLDKWLYPEDEESGFGLTLLQRLDIAINVASAMDYLHNDCKPPVVHCDLKPANVLLDENMTAHVGDFGLARLLSQGPSQTDNSTTGLKGSVGYIPPEYGLGSKASPSGDVYSFGILVLEMFVAKKPTDGMFKEGLSLDRFASAIDGKQVFKTVDPRLLNTNGGSEQSSFSTSSNESSYAGTSSIDGDHLSKKYEECLAGVIRVGLCCAAQSPKDRLSMREALTKLLDIKKILLN